MQFNAININVVNIVIVYLLEAPYYKII